MSGNLSRRHSAPDLISISVHVAGLGKPRRGSRFWTLQDDTFENSDEEDVRLKKCISPGRESYDSEKEFIVEATQAGFSLDELIRAEALLTENFQSPKFASVDRGAGHARQPRPLASRITEAVADLRMRKDENRWKRPLPRPRTPKHRQLGDIMVKDIRQSSTFNAAKSLEDFCSEKGT